jgi:para-aminobenzoate synthetase component I
MNHIRVFSTDICLLPSTLPEDPVLSDGDLRKVLQYLRRRYFGFSLLLISSFLGCCYNIKKQEIESRERIHIGTMMYSSPVAVIREISPPPSPLDAFRLLYRDGLGFLLESSRVDTRLGCWSFVGVDPFLVVSGNRRTVRLHWPDRTEILEGDPFKAVRELIVRYRIERQSDTPPLLGGAVGFFGYDLCQVLERLPSRALDDLGMPDFALGFYDVVVAFNHATTRTYLCSCGWPETTEKTRHERAQQRAEETLSALAVSRPDEICTDFTGDTLHSNFTRSDYLATIRRVKEYIAAGDIYQVNLSQRFSTPFTVSPITLYENLRQLSPAPFGGLLMSDDWALVSSSPERFLQVRGDTVETRPIKGTRPRGATPAEDARLAHELISSEKDRAENVMIVDLLRNDLGKVCDYGSVQTTELWALESYANVHHLVSTVEGRLRQGKTSMDCLRACFPGGSITGAPKVRSMEIIEELEPTKRGPYTGAIGYASFCGDMDTNIIIRTLVVKDGQAHFQVGGGIVADSDPDAEYEETLDKGRAMARALNGEM